MARNRWRGLVVFGLLQGLQTLQPSKVGCYIGFDWSRRKDQSDGAPTGRHEVHSHITTVITATPPCIKFINSTCNMHTQGIMQAVQQRIPVQHMKERGRVAAVQGWDTGMGRSDTMKGEDRDGKQDVGKTTPTVPKRKDDWRMMDEMTGLVSYTPGPFHLTFVQL